MFLMLDISYIIYGQVSQMVLIKLFNLRMVSLAYRCDIQTSYLCRTSSNCRTLARISPSLISTISTIEFSSFNRWLNGIIYKGNYLDSFRHRFLSFFEELNNLLNSSSFVPFFKYNQSFLFILIFIYNSIQILYLSNNTQLFLKPFFYYFELTNIVL